MGEHTAISWTDATGRLLGARKRVASLAGLSLEEYSLKIASGERRCTDCKTWKQTSEFNGDASRADGLSMRCKLCSSRRGKERYQPKPITRHGPLPHPPRDGDKKQARQRINVEVRTGKRPHPNAFPCADCGHIWNDGERRHEYDHYKGYAGEHHLTVESVCTLCHTKRDSARANAETCIRGHVFDFNNTFIKPNGTRACKECRRMRDRGRRDATFWREYRKKKEEAFGGSKK